MSFKPPRHRQSGVSLIELVMFIVIVGIALVGVLRMFDIGARASPDPMRRKQALAIAEGMMEEVRLAHFTFCDGNDPKAELPTTQSAADCTNAEGPGPETGNVRPYDNVNDYGGPYSADAAGNPFPTGYAVNVTVVQDGTFGAAGALVPSDAALRITVVVTYGADTVTLDGYRTRYAPRSL
ncbi:MAG: type II secretion system protein [Pseudomonadota bacterium]